MHFRHLTAAMLILLLQGCTLNNVSQEESQSFPVTEDGLSSSFTSMSATSERSTTPVEFSQFHPSFRFAAAVPVSWKIEFVPEISAINIYDSMVEAETKMEQSQLFIRSFEANSFLTLATVNILSREETKVVSHDAVRYEIEKKSAVAPFPHQPYWRSGRHRLVDIRLTAANPSYFYVFAYNPSLNSAVFETFLQSLRFHNDRESFHPPLPQAMERITKKPFGLEVSPGLSPVDPERFSGFHTGADFEILSGEESADVAVSAICGGAVRSKQSTEGYGGVIVQECFLKDQTITVVYGHLALRSGTATVGSYLAPGAKIGFLGAAGTEETDGERKHLHLGIHKGKELAIRGYVQSEEELEQFIDPAIVLEY